MTNAKFVELERFFRAKFPDRAVAEEPSDVDAVVIRPDACERVRDVDRPQRVKHECLVGKMPRRNPVRREVPIEEVKRSLTRSRRAMSRGKMLNDFLEKRGMKTSELYERIGMSRQMWSKIVKVDSDYVPPKATLFQIIIGLELEIADAEAFLRVSGYSFSERCRLDTVVRWCTENGPFGPFDVNDALSKLEEKPLFFN